MTTHDTERQKLNAVVFYAVVLLLGFLAFRIVQPFIQALAWAGILALCVQPLFRRLAPRFGRNKAAVLSTLAVTLVLILPAVFFAVALVGEATKAVSGVQSALDDVRNHERILAAWAWVQDKVPLPSIDVLKQRLMTLAGRGTALLAAQTGVIMQNASVFVFKLFITLFSLFFFLRDSAGVGAAIRDLIPFEEGRKDKLIAQTEELIYAGAMTTLTVAAAQGLAGGILFAVLGIRAPVFWGLVMGVTALIPLMGTAIVWVPTAIWLCISGAWVQGIILAVGGMAIVGGLDNVLRPFLMSGKSSMNMLLTLISLLGGVSAFGFIGLVLGPVVMATLMSLLMTGSDSAKPSAS